MGWISDGRGIEGVLRSLHLLTLGTHALAVAMKGALQIIWLMMSSRGPVRARAEGGAAGELALTEPLAQVHRLSLLHDLRDARRLAR